MKHYYCELDDSVFNTEEELVKHIKQRYVKVIEEKEQPISELYAKLQEDFPNHSIRIKGGEGWYADYLIELQLDNSVITQHFGNAGRSGSNPTVYKDLLDELEEKITTYQEIVNLAIEKYSFLEFNFNSFTYGYSEDEESYSFSFKTSKGDYDISYYPYDLEINEFIDELERYFATVLEGRPETYYDDGYFAGYKINGVRIDEIMTHKKVRLEIIS